MDYLRQFNQQLFDGQLSIRYNYVDFRSRKLNEEVDVITDLIEHQQMFAIACLPIAKQIGSEQTITLKLPKIGDLFVGLQHHPDISHVTMTLSNYTEEFEVDGHLQTINGLQMWRITELPIPLFLVDDYERINITFQITLKTPHNRQMPIQGMEHDVFLVYFGYLHHKLKSQAQKHHLLNLPLLERPYLLKMICGIWTLDKQS